jgi:hypothetical protein
MGKMQNTLFAEDEQSRKKNVTHAFFPAEQ